MLYDYATGLHYSMVEQEWQTLETAERANLVAFNVMGAADVFRILPQRIRATPAGDTGEGGESACEPDANDPQVPMQSRDVTVSTGLQER